MQERKRYPIDRKNHHQNKRILKVGLLFGVLAVIAFPALLLLMPRKLSKTRSLSFGPACTDHFDIQTYNGLYGPILVGELHGSNEKQVADCIESLSENDDHLLIEASENGKEVQCDYIYSTHERVIGKNFHLPYQRFNSKLKCYGFDVPIDDNRRIYNDLVGKVNMLFKLEPYLFTNVYSSKEVIERLDNFADMFQQQKHPADPNYTKKIGKYLSKLARKLSGLSVQQMHEFLIKENKILVDKAYEHEKLSRSGPTNEALARSIAAHQQQLVGSRFRLFTAVGARHLDLAVNSHLKAKIDSGEPTTILTPKGYGQ